jgi:predicted Zn-dependent peptidase
MTMTTSTIRVTATLLAAGCFVAGCGSATPPSRGPEHVDIPIAPVAAKEPNQKTSHEPPPAPLSSKESPFPKVSSSRLSNGLSVDTVEAHALPIVQLRVVVRVGNGYGGTPGAARLTAELLKDGGTRTMTSAQLLNRIESLGANLSVDVDFDSTVLGLAVTKDHLDEALRLVAEVVQDPAFDNGELNKLKARVKDEAEENARSNGSWMATRVMFRALFTERNPYSSYDVVPADLKSINGLVVRDFHKRFYVPKNSSVILVGDIDPAAATKAVEKSFGGWKGGDPPKTDFPPAIAVGRRQVVVVNRSKSAQSDIFVASLIAPRHSPDWPAIRVANQVFGGVPAGRLFLDVREQRSLAYSAVSRVTELAHGEQPLVVYVGTQTPKTAQAVAGALEDMDRMTSQPPDVAETESARRYLSDVFAIRMETIGSIANMVVQQTELGLPDGYWDTYRAALRATDAASAAAAGQKMFHADKALVVVAGDAETIAPSLAHFGEVTVVDPEREFQTVRTIPAEAAP